MVLEVEATMICVDDSEWMLKGDYPPTRLQAQADAAIFATKMASNPANTVGVLAMAGDRVRVLLALTSDPVKFLACMHGLEVSGEANLIAALNVAELVLKSRPDKRLSQRIVVFVGSPVKDEKLETIGKKLKKYNVSLDIVEFGESEYVKPEKLEALVAAVGGNSHIVHIPPGEDLRVVLSKTPIITGDGGGAASGGASIFEYGVDPNVNPELAEGIRLSAEEDIARQEAAAGGASRFESGVDPNVDPELAESASVTLADDERATEEGLRTIQALARSENAARAETSGEELELDLPPFLPSLLQQDFAMECFSRLFCSDCPGDVCGLCCPEHVPTHHAGGNGVVVEVHMVEGSSALSHRTVRNHGLGYDWRKIQRVEYQQSKWVMIGQNRPRSTLSGMRGKCKGCKGLISLRNQYCCPACKVLVVQTGRSRNIMQSLVRIDFHRSHTRDRFCTMCWRAFSSERCLDHSVHHSIAEQPNIHILHIVRHDGWLLIPYEQLPSDLTSGVRRVKLEDGSFAIPLRPRIPPIQDGDYSCSRLDCEEGVHFAANVCSILCKIFAHIVPD